MVVTSKRPTLKTMTPPPGTPTATFRSKRGRVGGVSVWLKGSSPTSGNYRFSPYRERAAYVLDCVLTLKIVPPTVLHILKGEVVSAQKWVRGVYPDSDQAPLLLLLLDYIIHNTDRHQGNWLVKPSGRVWAIDNAMSFDSRVGVFYDECEVDKLPYRVKYQLRRALKDTQKLHRRLDDLIGEVAVEAILERIGNVVSELDKEENGE